MTRQIIVQFELHASAYAGGNTIARPLYPIAASVTSIELMWAQSKP
jgi:hypothetical protein